MRVRSLALLRGLRILHCCGCGVGYRHGSDLALLWLWYRPAAVALIQPLAWEPTYAVGVALKRQIIIIIIKDLGFIFVFSFFLGPHLQHMEVPRLGVESELQLSACATATATPDLSHVCNLHRSSPQHRILNP